VTPEPAAPTPRRDIAPLTGLRFIAAMVVVLHHYPVPGVAGTLQTMLQSAISALLMQAWSEDASHAFALNGPGWSLSVEAFLYACFPLLIVVLQRAGVFTSGRRLAAAFILVSIAMVAIAVYFALAVAAMLAFMAMPGNIDSTYSRDVLHAFPGVLLIVGLALAPETALGRVLGLPAVVLLGESSYCLYLLQAPLGVLRIADGSLSLGGQIVLHALFIGLLVATSIGVHMAIERPLQRAIRGAYARWGQRQVRISTAARGGSSRGTL
jgi:peptidoglycan/LPS O-acetylase OafA/YrhL